MVNSFHLNNSASIFFFSLYFNRYQVLGIIKFQSMLELVCNKGHITSMQQRLQPRREPLAGSGVGGCQETCTLVGERGLPRTWSGGPGTCTCKYIHPITTTFLSGFSLFKKKSFFWKITINTTNVENNIYTQEDIKNLKVIKLNLWKPKQIFKPTGVLECSQCNTFSIYKNKNCGKYLIT